MENKNTPFIVFILTHGRPDKVVTYDALRRCRYTGPIRLLVDDLDKTISQYKEKYGNEVIIFDKKKYAFQTDMMNNFNDLRSAVFARNASFDIAKELGYTYFLQLEDDYTDFSYRFNNKLEYVHVKVKNLDAVWDALIKFYINTPTLSIAFSQGGDFIGGDLNEFAQALMLKRKCMNSFLCSTERPIKFSGIMNDDVTTYTTLGNRGELFFTTSHISLNQLATQANSGGMTELYLDSGTYLKTFYSIIAQPSYIKVNLIGSANRRLHHKISWRYAVPLILSESLRKQ